MRDSYLTIAASIRAEIKVERSRFIATATPVDSKATAEAAYEQIRKEFHDATHNCLAYQLGMEPSVIFRYSDDGEPSGTAGKPIYDAILGRDLTDIMIVVTRYFGGIKLGTGGLGRAYRDAAAAVLDNASVVERFLMQDFKLRFAHEQISAVMKLLSDFGLKPLDTIYGDDVLLAAAIRRGQFEIFRNAFVDRTHGKAAIEKIEEEA